MVPNRATHHIWEETHQSSKIHGLDSWANCMIGNYIIKNNQTLKHNDDKTIKINKC